MDRKTKEVVDEAIHHSEKATQLLRTSNEIHQAEKQGLIGEKDALEICLNLNEQAIAEADKAIELRKEFFERQDSK